MNLFEKLKGKKTYIVAAVIAVVNLLAAFGVIDAEQIESINLVLAALGVGTIRHAMAKTKK